jgi:hypothetical protein
MTIFASAPSLETISECITRFYMGEVKTLEVEREGSWTVHNSDGMPLLGVRVVKRGKRYRFETVL